MSGCSGRGWSARSRNGTRSLKSVVLTFPSWNICQTISWTHVVPEWKDVQPISTKHQLTQCHSLIYAVTRGTFTVVNDRFKLGTVHFMRVTNIFRGPFPVVNIPGYVKKLTWSAHDTMTKCFDVQGTRLNHNAPSDTNSKLQGKLALLRCFHSHRCPNQ